MERDCFATVLGEFPFQNQGIDIEGGEDDVQRFQAF